MDVGDVVKKLEGYNGMPAQVSSLGFTQYGIIAESPISDQRTRFVLAFVVPIPQYVHSSARAVVNESIQYCQLYPEYVHDITLHTSGDPHLGNQKRFVLIDYDGALSRGGGTFYIPSDIDRIRKLLGKESLNLRSSPFVKESDM